MIQVGSINSIRFAEQTPLPAAVPVPAAAVPVVVKVPLDTRTIASKESVQTVFTKREIIAPVKAAVVVPVVVPVPAPVVVVKREPISLDACMDPMPIVKVKERAPKSAKTAKPLAYGNGNKLIIIDGDEPEPEPEPELDCEHDIHDDLVGESIRVQPSSGKSSMNFAPEVN